jgi:hypothetical protein
MKRTISVKYTMISAMAALLFLAWGAGDALAGGRRHYAPPPRYLYRAPGPVVYFGFPIYRYQYRPAPRPHWRERQLRRYHYRHNHYPQNRGLWLRGPGWDRD